MEQQQQRNAAQELKNISRNWNSYLSCPSQIFYSGRGGVGGEITVLKNPNKDNPGLKERKSEKSPLSSVKF